MKARALSQLFRFQSLKQVLLSRHRLLSQKPAPPLQMKSPIIKSGYGARKSLVIQRISLLPIRYLQ
ncbi:hypothetical protein ABW48_10855 [Pluralibacter gergoviae]|nr:hypothetical protein ABW48_10855 [Pluralibacter gergoviae]